MITYEIHSHDGQEFVVVRVKSYRRDVVGCYPSEEAARAEIKFQESMDDDKARDRAGY